MIEVKDLVKTYPLSSSPLKRLGFYAGFSYAGEQSNALDGVSLNVAPGEVLGVIGENGQGKSSLLKILAGITAPTKGSVTVKGRISAILEMSSGMQSEWTGEENTLLKLGLLGIKKSTAKKISQEIHDFSGIGPSFFWPVRTYSTGMAARLAFAIATAEISEVLLLDELPVVGDLLFQRQVFDRLKKISREGRACVIVSHDLGLIQKLCDRVIWIKKGKIHTEGKPYETVKIYHREFENDPRFHYPREFAEIVDLKAAATDHDLVISTYYKVKKQCDDLFVQIVVRDQIKGLICYLLNSALDGFALDSSPGHYCLKMMIPLPRGIERPLVAGAVARGKGIVARSCIEDAWGLDNGKEARFETKPFQVQTPYFDLKPLWNV